MSRCTDTTKITQVSRIRKLSCLYFCKDRCFHGKDMDHSLLTLRTTPPPRLLQLDQMASSASFNSSDMTLPCRDTFTRRYIWDPKTCCTNIYIYTCHVPLKRDQGDWDWRLRLNDTPNAIGYNDASRCHGTTESFWRIQRIKTQRLRLSSTKTVKWRPNGCHSTRS